MPFFIGVYIMRIGFACKKISNPSQVNGLSAKDPDKRYNTGTTTVAWLSRQTVAVAENKLRDLVAANLDAAYNLVEYVSKLQPMFRMVRLSSDILPVYTHENWSYFYQSDSIKKLLQQKFSRIGDLAKQHDVRLSFHPGQFCVLASHRADVVKNSIAEFEYHADMARFMGYGKQFQDIKLNVHLSGKGGPDVFRDVYARLSVVAQRCITIENDEFSGSLDYCLQIADLCPIVLDIHHHYINSGEYISSDDSRIQRVIDSWRGVRPVIHYSQSQESILSKHCTKTKPDLSALISEGYSKSKLRAHSDFYWNTAVNDWALTHLSWADIMCESKAKNLAVEKLTKCLILKLA
jgi:UV damage endonuclease UvdE